jgi:hypothetical protein
MNTDTSMTTDQANDVIMQALIEQQIVNAAKIADFDARLASLQAERNSLEQIRLRNVRMMAIHSGEESVTVTVGKQRTKRVQTDSADPATIEARKIKKDEARNRYLANKMKKADAAAAQPSPKPVASPSKTKKTA